MLRQAPSAHGPTPVTDKSPSLINLLLQPLAWPEEVG